MNTLLVRHSILVAAQHAFLKSSFYKPDAGILEISKLIGYEWWTRHTITNWSGLQTNVLTTWLHCLSVPLSLSHLIGGLAMYICCVADGISTTMPP